MPETFEQREPGFARIVPRNATLERIAGGFTFTEGPLWNDDHLLFTDIPNSRIVRWQRLPEGPEVRTHRAPTNLANGLAFDRRHRLLVCEGATRRLTRLDPNGSVEVLADRYQGKRINGPNDVVVASDGTIYFTDPFWTCIFPNPFGPAVQPSERELPCAFVFRLAPDGTLSVAADNFLFPNGLTLSPDGQVLYVDDSRLFHLRAYDVQPDGTLANGRVFAELRAPEFGAPDGMKVDAEGNLYCTGPGGIWVISPAGEILGRILPPEQPSNVAWGDPDRRTLYVTARTSVYRVRLNIPGP